MNQNFFLTTPRYENYASTRAQGFGGTVLVLRNTSFGNPTTTSNSGDSEGDTIIPTLRIGDSWSVGAGTPTDPDRGVESDLLRTGIVARSDWLPIGMFAIVWERYMPAKDILFYIASSLREYDHFVKIVSTKIIP